MSAEKIMIPPELYDEGIRLAKKAAIVNLFLPEATDLISQLLSLLWACPDLEARASLARGLNITLSKQLMMLAASRTLPPLEQLRLIEWPPAGGIKFSDGTLVNGS